MSVPRSDRCSQRLLVIAVERRPRSRTRTSAAVSARRSGPARRASRPRCSARRPTGPVGSQTFGITSGTLGCHQGGTVTADAKVQIFTVANLDRLARDMAQGGGETLDAFASLLGIRAEDKPAFFQLTQTRFADLFAGDAVTAGAMLDSLERAMAGDRALRVVPEREAESEALRREFPTAVLACRRRCGALGATAISRARSVAPMRNSTPAAGTSPGGSVIFPAIGSEFGLARQRFGSFPQRW